MAPKIPPADPLTGTETAIVIQGGKPVRTSTQAIANKAPSATAPLVTAVAGKTGDVTLTKADVGLNNVNNTADANKPVSTAQAAAIAAGKLRVSRFSGATDANGIAKVAFSPAFAAAPDVDVVEGWSGNQMITGAVVPGTITTTGCSVQVMTSVGTLILNTSPFSKAGAGVSVTVRAIGN